MMVEKVKKLDDSGLELEEMGHVVSAKPHACTKSIEKK